eukprot:3744593-Prymnesium_polylepis.1
MDAPAAMTADAGGGAGDAGGDGEGSGARTVDFSFYSAFWRLQTAFAEPTKAVAADAWEPLVEQLES